MAMMFPNASRSYDATRRAVRFWGHDNAMEWSFFVTADALKLAHPAMRDDEAGMLAAFELASRSNLRRSETTLYAWAQRLLRAWRGGYVTHALPNNA